MYYRFFIPSPTREYLGCADFSVGIIPRSMIVGLCNRSMLVLLKKKKNLPNCLSKWLDHFSFPLTMNKSSFCFISSAFDVNVMDFCHFNNCYDNDCKHEIKRSFLLRRKAMPNLDRVVKNRDITLPTKVCIVKVMVFPVVMYGYESWTIKKAECQRTDAFELWCWRRLLRVPWTARRSNQSILKEINPIGRTDAEAEAPIL